MKLDNKQVVINADMALWNTSVFCNIAYSTVEKELFVDCPFFAKVFLHIESCKTNLKEKVPPN